jgi:hypothetical protein
VQAFFRLWFQEILLNPLKTAPCVGANTSANHSDL